MTDRIKELNKAMSSAENVTAMPRQLSNAGQSILARITHAAEIRPVIDRPYLVKGWIDRGAVSVVYGAPNVGKTFWAIDMAHHVQEGQPWAGYRVKQGNVLYIAAEGGAMFANRLYARRARFHILQHPLNLGTGRGDATALIEAINALADKVGGISLIVIDTLSRVMGGADENSAGDMARFVSTIDRIKESTGAHVMLVHHSGKDAAKGMRGSSVLLGAIDTEIELTAEEDEFRKDKFRQGQKVTIRSAKTTKQRDWQGGLERGFQLNPEELGIDADGDRVFSCIIHHHNNTEDFA